MLLDHLVSQRWQNLVREALRFGTVGGINFVISFAVFNALVLTVFAQGQLKANVIATVLATTASYLMNRHWTYRDRPKSAMHREYVLFFVFNGVGLAIELGVLGMAKYGFGLTSLLALNLAKFLAVGLGTVFRFWAYRTFVFKRVATKPAPRATTAPAHFEEPDHFEEYERELAEPFDATTDAGVLDTSLDAGVGVEWDTELTRRH